MKKGIIPLLLLFSSCSVDDMPEPETDNCITSFRYEVKTNHPWKGNHIDNKSNTIQSASHPEEWTKEYQLINGLPLVPKVEVKRISNINDSLRVNIKIFFNDSLVRDVTETVWNKTVDAAAVIGYQPLCEF